MTTNSTPLAWGSIVLGCIFALGTLKVLATDVNSISDVTTDHMMTVLVLIGTLASGHMGIPELRKGHAVRALGLVILFLSGTAYCVATSAARNAETTSGQLAKVSDNNAKRSAAEEDVKKAKTDLDDAMAASRAECRTGKKVRCEGTLASVDTAQAMLERAEAKLAKAPVHTVENAGWKHAALVGSIFLDVHPDKIERTLDLVLPFVKSAFLELATLVFFGIGLHKPVSKRQAPVSEAVPVEFQLKPANENNVLDWISEFRRFHGRDPQIPEVQQQFHIARTTAWRRIKAAS